ncbi:(d)CMP kinase [Tsukamurella sp. 8F]|uniref:(d)CMP kinase n=1 Tax=unclassified Tsukamurella TaxID=2633480 RepID=UPI0023B89ACC|nr:MULTISPECIES: (d)CMP kinase [unclassified Tsukamurella]MDF0532223.1 (d)CMP kinase [Tsukamurella sp. 8J]MDF0588072.1 (d)CMP kinase [Tsukamurella sp. 8F]
MDGPSGTGKSTVARRVAERLAARYLDTGAMYRAATVHVLDAGVDPADADAVDAATRDLPLAVGCDPTEEIVELDGVSITRRIREDDVTANVSAVSAVPALRERLVDYQRAIAGDDDSPVVIEGRDIGTVVFPDAALKVYLTASARARAERRHAQNLELGLPSDLGEVLASVQRRDELDSTRKASPLRPADGAEQVDTSGLTLDETVDAIVALVNERTGVTS